MSRKPKTRRNARYTTVQVASMAGIAKPTVFYRALRLGLKCRPPYGVKSGDEAWWTKEEARAIVNYGKGKR